MIPQKNCLKSKGDFKELFLKGKKLNSFSFFIRYNTLFDNIKPQLKIGLTISKKVSKKANVRNRLKRQLRAILRTNLLDNPEYFQIKNIIVVAKPEIIKQKYKDLNSEMKNLLINLSYDRDTKHRVSTII